MAFLISPMFGRLKTTKKRLEFDNLLKIARNIWKGEGKLKSKKRSRLTETFESYLVVVTTLSLICNTY